MFKARTGQRFGRLVFIRHLGLDEHKHHRWEARCDCGVLTVTTTPTKTKSCGCLHRETAALTQRAKKLPPEQKEASRRASAAKQRAIRKNNPAAVMQARVSRLHRHALSKVGAIKKSATFEQLGYSVDEFVQHIERQFLSGMGWHNMRQWQIDHIVPTSTAKSEADVVALNQLPNMRPMWAKENNAKKAKIISLL